MSKFRNIKSIKRKCLVCGKAIKIKVYLDGHYTGGHYFNKVKLPLKGTGEHVKTGSVKVGRSKIDVMKWTGKEKEIEYWECNACFEEALHEGWLEEIIEKLYGKRCKDYTKSCPCCEAWSVFDTIIDHNRGRL